MCKSGINIMSHFFHGPEHDFKRFNQGVKRPAQCHAKGIIFEEKDSQKVIGVECGCGKKHPVESGEVFSPGAITGFEAVADDTKTSTYEKVLWEKELNYKPGYWQSGGY